MLPDISLAIVEVSLWKLLGWRTLLSVKVFKEPLRGATLEVKIFNCYQVNSFDEKKEICQSSWR